MNKNFSAIILSSGFSERMGQSKAFLKWDQSTTFIEKIINEFEKFGCTRIICMINKIIEPTCKTLNVSQNIKFIINHHPEWGRFHSIKTGLCAVKDSDFCFIHNVDNPFVDRITLEKLFQQRSHDAWCSPVYKDKGGHPVLLSQSIIHKIVEIDNLNSTLSEILNSYPKIKVEVDNNLIFRNINTPEDYGQYFKY